MTRPVWLFSNLPPPVHGVSMFNAMLVGSLEQRHVPHRVFRIGTRGSVAQVEQFGVRKLYEDAVTLMQLLLAASKQTSSQPPVVYFTPSLMGSALYRDVALTEACSKLGLAMVAHIHNGAWLAVRRAASIAQRTLMMRVLRHCESVICLGESLAHQLSAATGVRCVGINNGIVSALEPQPRNAPTEALELLFLSNLQREKGLWTAAEATRLLAANGRPVRLRCAGAWRIERDANAFAHDFAPELASGTIVLAGFADEPAKSALLATSHFLVLPTELQEGQPLSIIEAMAAGVVPITTPVGGIPDLFDIADRDQLAAATHTDAQALAATISELASSPSEYARLADECRRRYLTELTFDQCADRVLYVLQGAG